MNKNTLEVYITINFPEGIERIWKKKFGVKTKPHHDKKCKECKQRAGDHLFPNYDCPKK